MNAGHLKICICRSHKLEPKWYRLELVRQPGIPPVICFDLDVSRLQTFITDVDPEINPPANPGAEIGERGAEIVMATSICLYLFSTTISGHPFPTRVSTHPPS